MDKKLIEVFGNIDSKILESEDFQSKIGKYLSEASEELAESKATKLFEAKLIDYEKSLDEMVESATKAIELDQKEKFNEAVDSKVEELVEAYGIELQEDAERKLTEEVAKIEEDTKKYIELAVKEFSEEAMPKWEAEAKVARAEKIEEEFSLIAEAFGVKISKVDESEEVQKLKESLDKSIEREKLHEGKINDLISDKLLSEAKKNISVVQADKLSTLMEEVEFVSESQYKNKLDQFVAVVGDSVQESKRVKPDANKTASWNK